MKKSTLALSVAAALAGFGFIGQASAMVTLAAGAATVVERNADGIGHQLVVPYFTTQLGAGAGSTTGNNTLLQITNNDLVNGKLVKVRFRGAGNSDDLLDFTLLLSPGDVWNAAITQNATTKLSRLTTTDKSCVLPAGVAAAGGVDFLTSRTDATPARGTVAEQTREGYVEIINMANIAPLTPAFSATVAAVAATNGALFDTIKHTAPVAPSTSNTAPACNASVLDNNLGTDAPNDIAAYAANSPSTTGANNRGMTQPTGGLSADWIIINQDNVTAWSGAASALEARIAAGGAPAAGVLQFWPQKVGTATYGVNTVTGATADPLLVTGILTPQWLDFPDLSTPVTTVDIAAAAGGAASRANLVTAALAVRSLAHQYWTDSAFSSATDVVFSQPTRRYNVAVNYIAAAATDNNTLTTGTLASANYRAGQTFYTAANSDPVGRQVCVTTVNAPGKIAGLAGLFDNEETTPAAATTNFVISPASGVGATILNLCGEASVVSVNQGGVTNASLSLSANVARSDVTFTDAAYLKAGWMVWDLTTANAAGLPVIANTFLRAANGTKNYGFAWPAKVTR